MLATPTGKDINESINIEQDNKKYILLIKIQGDTITLIVSEPGEIENPTFIKKMTLQEIKQKHNVFLGLTSCNEFSDYLKALSERKKLSIINKDDKLCINLSFEYLFKTQYIDIALSPEKKKSDEIIQDLIKEISSLKEKIKILENKSADKTYESLKNEIKCLKEEIKDLKKIIESIDKKFKENNNINNNIYKWNNKSVIMKENEFDFIHLAIKSRINKTVKELKKLYQATIDGDRAINFHSKCDNIPYTLVIIKSGGNRRFGGFTSKPWSSPSNWQSVDDKNAFLFSLDKQKIYPYKNDNKAFYNHKDGGPTFGAPNDIQINSKCLQEKNSYTYESYPTSSYNYYEDNNALSEDGKASFFYVIEYEVFQIIFA